MDSLTASWVEATKKALTSLQKKYEIYRGLLLTEGDLECHMFSELLQQKELSGYHSTKSGSYIGIPFNGADYKSTFVHSQVTWFKPGEKSGFEVDLTISDPAKLEVKNIELFDKYTSKGFAYDGECVAIELKFIRDESDASQKAHQDYLKLRDKLIPSKLANIGSQYNISTADNIAFISVVGCKDKEIFKKAKHYLGKHLCATNKSCPENLLIWLFYQDEIIWDKNSLMAAYHQFNHQSN